MVSSAYAIEDSTAEAPLLAAEFCVAEAGSKIQGAS
jgi:hypothetical protein